VNFNDEHPGEHWLTHGTWGDEDPEPPRQLGGL